MKTRLFALLIVFVFGLILTVTGPQPICAAEEAGMAVGEIRRIDAAAGKITIRHGEIAELNMPPMTMVFQVRDTAMLEGLQRGETIRFRAIEEDGRFFVTHIVVVR